jgi:hypothetical protein
MEGVKDLVEVLTTSNRNKELETAVNTVIWLGKVEENKLKLLEEGGLIGGLVRVMGQRVTGNGNSRQDKRLRMAMKNAVAAINSIACGADADVFKRLFKHEDHL